MPLEIDLVVPKFGVYASLVTLESGERFGGVTNVGVKPTVGGTVPLWETWMPDYHGGEIYGQTADVRLLKFLRPGLGKASALPRFFVQPDVKSCYAIRTPELCGIAYS